MHKTRRLINQTTGQALPQKETRKEDLMSVQDVAEKFYSKCSREAPGPANRDMGSRAFWNRVFLQLDKETVIPAHRRKEVLETLINPQILPVVLEILNSSEESQNALKTHSRSFLNLHEPAVLKKKHSFHTLRDLDDVNIKEYSEIKDYRHEEKLTDNENMYQKFLKKSEDTAGRWRPEAKLILRHLDLGQECEGATENIAQQFVEWMDDIGGTTQTQTLTKDAVKALFEIGFNAHCADSLTVKVRELNAVPLPIALAQRTPDASYSSQLYKQLFRDVNQIRSRSANYAFGTMLPQDMRAPIESDSMLVKWLDNKRVPLKLADMEVVWEGIEKFRTTRGYCRWLTNSPNLQPPRYLEKMLLNSKMTVDEDTTRNVSLMSPRNAFSEVVSKISTTMSATHFKDNK